VRTDTRIEAAALLFDMDGVLLDSRLVVERTWRRWASRHRLSAESLLRVAHGRRTQDTLRIAAPELATAQEVAWIEGAELEDLDGVRPIPGSVPLIAALPPSRWTVVTSAGRELATGRLAAVGLHLPDSAVTSDDVERGKPFPDGYLLAAARLGVTAADCLVVEDAPPGIQAGRAAGARVLALTTTHAREDLAGADHVVPDLRSVQVTAGAATLAILIKERPSAT
jgi:sugar-phosphatase